MQYQIVFVLSVLILASNCSLNSVLAKNEGKLQYEDIKQIAKKVLDNDLVDYCKPEGFRYPTNQKYPVYTVAEIKGLPFQGENRFKQYLEPLNDQILIELYRRYLFADREDKKFMEPHYQAAEKIVTKKINVINQHDGSFEQLQKKLEQFKIKTVADRERSVGGRISIGIWALAKTKGYSFVGSVAPKEESKLKRIIIEPSAKLEIVSSTAALIAEATGIDEDDDKFPWDTYYPDDKVALGGKYRIRLTYKGKVGKSFERSILFKDSELKLPIQ